VNAAIYNENAPYPAAWLENLIAAGHLPPGRVDKRSIKDLVAADVAGPGHRHFFAGIGGFGYALRRVGVPDGASVWSGSCPCQGFSNASSHTSRAGFDDPRHLWPDWFKLIRECSPPLLVGEQVASKDGLGWLDLVFADLEHEGYACAAINTCAASVGAPHIRQRIYFVAFRPGADWLGNARRDGDWQHARKLSRDEAQHEERAAHGDHASSDPSAARDFWRDCEWLPGTDGRSRAAQPGTLPLVARLPGHVEQLRAYGNSINTEQAVAFLEAAIEAVEEARTD
jgi:DNA (cytosine-5)-methyltransferase 1